MSLPALRLVARAFPHHERVLLTNYSQSTKVASMAAVLEGTGLVHGYLRYPIGLRGMSLLLKLRRAIRELNPDALVYLVGPRGRPKAWRDAAFFYACGIRRLIGVPYRADQQRNRRLPDGDYEYEGARLLRCLEELGNQSLESSDAFDLSLSESEHQEAKRALGPLGDGGPLIAASIGAQVDVKDWGDRAWHAVLHRLADQLPGWGLLMVGAAEERQRSDALRSSWRGASLNACGMLSVRASAALLSQARIYVGHDSGPMHLAAAVGVPCVAVFSSRNLPGQWFPFGATHRVLYHRISCQGCGLDRCVERQKECIRSIPVEDVARNVMELVGQVVPAIE